jgi:hypothetical protein
MYLHTTEIRSELRIKKDSTLFWAEKLELVFFNLKHKISPLSVPVFLVEEVEANRLVPLLTSLFLGGQYLQVIPL